MRLHEHEHADVHDDEQCGDNWYVPRGVVVAERQHALGVRCGSATRTTAEPELAVKYIDLHLEAPIQQEMLKAPYDAIPTNANVKFEGAITNAIAKSGADLTKVHHIDWAKLNPQRGALIDRFNREIKV